MPKNRNRGKCANTFEQANGQRSTCKIVIANSLARIIEIEIGGTAGILLSSDPIPQRTSYPVRCTSTRIRRSRCDLVMMPKLILSHCFGSGSDDTTAGGWCSERQSPPPKVETERIKTSGADLSPMGISPVAFAAIKRRPRAIW
jgi:hypothetical protein